MPSTALFDFYETLNIQKDATPEEIKSAYRRLALIHHPDKDRENPEATEKFQRVSFPYELAISLAPHGKDRTQRSILNLLNIQIQLAHETLSNPTQRARYDARSKRSTGSDPMSHTNFYDWDEDDSFEEDDYAIFEDILRSRSSRSGPFSGFSFGGFTFSFGSGFSTPDDEEFERRYAESRARQEEENARIREEMRVRREAEEERAKARAAARKAEELLQQQLREKKEKEERVVQEKLWEGLGVTSVADKQASCLHTSFWPKEQQKKKFRCTSCNQKRGMTGYRCPHCSILACQVCLNGFNKKRAAE
jgi:curved DNA-binding protein CbpA